MSEKTKGHILDPEKIETQEFMWEILLTDKQYSKNATKKLEENIIESGQREPAIISCDGIIWNGNRRVAVLRQLGKNKGDPKWSRVKGVFLPPLSKKELKQLEHRLQVGYDYKEPYSKISLCLDCRKMHREEGWTIAELENSFGGRYNQKAIMSFIRHIDLIDEYLERIKQKGNYMVLREKGVEFFAAIDTHLIREKNKLGTDPVGVAKIKTEFFAACTNPNSTFDDARILGKILSNPTTRKTYLENSQINKNYGQYTTPDSSGSEKAFAIDTTKVVMDNINATHSELLATAIDTPSELVEKALKKLEEIKVENVEPDDSDFFNTLERLENKVSRLKGLGQE